MIYKVLYFIKICLCVRCRCGNIYCAKKYHHWTMEVHYGSENNKNKRITNARFLINWFRSNYFKIYTE